MSVDAVSRHDVTEPAGTTPLVQRLRSRLRPDQVRDGAAEVKAAVRV
jgi:hypothetical protein